MLQYRPEDMGVVIDAELIGYGQQQRVGRADCFVDRATEAPEGVPHSRSIGVGESPRLQGLKLARLPESQKRLGRLYVCNGAAKTSQSEAEALFRPSRTSTVANASLEP